MIIIIGATPLHGPLQPEPARLKRSSVSFEKYLCKLHHMSYLCHIIHVYYLKFQYASQIHISHKRLCETKNQDVRLMPKDNYEFLPKIYTEIRCKNAMLNNVNVFVDKTNGVSKSIFCPCT